MFLVNIYSNEITSLVTIATPVDHHETLKDAVSDGYKILWLSNSVRTPEDEYGKIFRVQNIKPGISESFELYNQSYNLEQLAVDFISKKFMYISTTTYVFQHLVESKLAIRRHLVKQNDSGNGFDCHTTHEKLHQFHSFKEFNTINRHWLVQSVSRMRESGLINEWEHLQNWAMMLGNDVPIEMKEI